MSEGAARVPIFKTKEMKNKIETIKKQGLSQIAVARVVGISGNAMCGICNNKTFPNKTTLDGICSVLKVKFLITVESDRRCHK